MATTGTVDVDQVLLTNSIRDFTTYPVNLVASRGFPHAHGWYADRLGENNVFHKSASAKVRFVDIEDDGNGALHCLQQSATDLESLKKLLVMMKPDPHHRFIHFKSETSRGRLECSVEEMKLVLTALQVMAPFVDLILTFRHREDPHKLATFKFENHLDLADRKPGLMSLGRSGIRIQRCFNTLGIEYDYKRSSWQPRQISAYHSFDLLTGRAAWIVIKGNKTIRDRLQSSALDALQRQPESSPSICHSFGQTLRDNLLILQWCTEGWPDYLEMMEQECGRLTVMTRFLGVQELAENEVKWREEERLAESADGTEDPDTKPIGMIKKMSSTLTGLSRSHTGINMKPPRRQLSMEQKLLKLSDQASFADMQKLRHCSVELQQTMSRLEQSARVVGDIRSNYHNLVRSDKFRQHLTKKQAKGCLNHMDDFEAQLDSIVSSLNSFRARAQIIHDCTQHSGDVFNHIFQERSMFTSEYFAASSRESADAMEAMTERMHQKTMSMHVVTIVTLIFLPGTFVATVFSSGILTFGEEGSEGLGKNLGDWKVRLAGLKLFFTICVPLLCITLFVWFAAYRSSWMKKKQVDEEKGAIPDVPVTSQNGAGDNAVIAKSKPQGSQPKGSKQG